MTTARRPFQHFFLRRFAPEDFTPQKTRVAAARPRAARPRAFCDLRR